MSQSSGFLALSTKIVEAQSADQHNAYPGICALGTPGHFLIAYRRANQHLPAAGVASYIVTQTTTNYGNTWSPRTVLVTADVNAGYDVRDCSLTRLSTGRIVLTCFWFGLPALGTMRQSFYMLSDDDGRSWTSPTNFVSSYLPSVVNVRGIGISGPALELPNGDLLTFHYESFGIGFNNPQNSVICMKSTDHGSTWADLSIVANGDTYNHIWNETVGVYLADGSVYVAMRTDDEEKAFFARSTDSGATWTVPANTGIQSNGRPYLSPQLANGCVAIIYRVDNVVEYRCSWDNCTTWNADASGLAGAVIDETQRNVPGGKGAYAHALVVDPNTLGVIYGAETAGLSRAYEHFTYLYDNTLTDPFVTHAIQPEPAPPGGGLDPRTKRIRTIHREEDELLLIL